MQRKKNTKMAFDGPSTATVMKAALLIQNWFRRYKSRLEARRKIAWVVYQSIDNSHEIDQRNLHKFFQELLRHVQKKTREDTSNAALMVQSASTRLALSERLLKFGDEDDKQLELKTPFEHIIIEKSYPGAILSFPLRAFHINLLIQQFKANLQLHPKYLLQLLYETRLFLKTKPTISKFNTSISGKVTVVGDLHGHLDDLLVIFDKNGLPGVSNPYVFSGNFVDQGPKSVEVIALLFACLLVWPTAVFLNRGSHEDFRINCRFGFLNELERKYLIYCRNIFRLVSDLFAWLPLATIIDNRIFVTHGGISDKVDLNVLAKLERHQVDSIDLRLATSTNKVKKHNLELVSHLLWNDPHPQPGFRQNDKRGAIGIYFGPDVTANFLKRSGLSMIVRSHQCFSDGYQYFHNRTVLSIFSVSSYYSKGSNKGAFVRFDSDGQAHIFQYIPSKIARVAMGRRITSVEEDALRALRAKVAASKTELVKAFRCLDPGITGFVSLLDWCNVMKTTLRLDLPWVSLHPHLTAVQSQTKSIPYMSTFEQVSIKHRLLESETVTEVLYKNKDDLEEIFRILDKDNSGYISLDEFMEGCRLLGQATGCKVPENELEKIIKAIDINSDGKINFNEFLEAFRLVDCPRSKSQV